ncbi:MAG: dephospho-CoA kinase [Coriobacteriia bacterium]|nr:dephospho-CoA kinase [Coriobacteriia bacterium]
MDTLIVTGPICSGKSTYIAARVKETDSDALVLELDKIGHEILGELYGEVDRAALADIVFEDPAELAKLEAELHPRILARAHERAIAFAGAHPNGYVIVEAALPLPACNMPEIAQWLATAKTHVCEASYEERLTRALARGMTQHDFERRNRVQAARQ